MAVCLHLCDRWCRFSDFYLANFNYYSFKSDRLKQQLGCLSYWQLLMHLRLCCWVGRSLFNLHQNLHMLGRWQFLNHISALWSSLLSWRTSNKSKLAWRIRSWVGKTWFWRNTMMSATGLIWFCQLKVIILASLSKIRVKLAASKLHKRRINLGKCKNLWKNSRR